MPVREALDAEGIRRLLRDNGLTFADVANACGDGNDPLAVAAVRQWYEEGQVEFDDNPVISRDHEGGAYVMAWVWVDPPYDESEFGPGTWSLSL